MFHTYYEPTEYEQMYIAAGWMSLGDLDPEYLAYKRNEGHAMDYEDWTSTRREYDELNTAYKNEIETLYKEHGYDYSLPYELEIRQNELLKDMSRLEVWLGY